MLRRVSRRASDSAGFSLVDLAVTVGVFGIIAAIAVPRITSSLEGQRLGIEVRNVERELQTARMAAVTANQPVRVRFNCPATGQYRRVELIGSLSTPAADDADASATTRCNYPYPAADSNVLTRPNNDGPIVRLGTGITFTASQTLEFWPNGTVHVSGATSPWPLMGTTPASIGLAKGTTTKTITVNSLGKIQIQ